MTPSAVQLSRVRWSVRAALALGVAASVVTNVLAAQPSLVGRAIAAWPPLALLLTVELISRVPVRRAGLARVRVAATAAIAGIAAWVSYWHMVAVAERYGESAASARLIPLSVDGLVVVASVCLVELAGHLRTNPVPVTDSAPVPERAADPSPAPPAARTGASAPTRTAARGAARTGRRTGTRTDSDLLAVLAGVPREPDGSVPVRRAAAALGCGPDRARRLLAGEGPLRTNLTVSSVVEEAAA